MSTLVINKKSLKTWLHTDSVLGSFIISKFYFNADGVNFQIVEQGQSKRVIYAVSDITIVDDTDGGAEYGPYGTITELSLQLETLKYPAFYVDGSFNSITGLIEAGTNVTITGSGTESDPYVISSSGGGGGSVTSVNGDTGVVVVDLQSATDEGNLTTNDIKISFGDGAQLKFTDGATELGAFYINSNSVAFQDSPNARIFQLNSEDLTADRIYVLPDKNGTFAMLDDVTGVSDGDKGDITVGSSGTVWNIDNGAVSNAKVASGIDAVKIADGSVSNAEFQRLDGVTSNIQTQLNNRVGYHFKNTTQTVVTGTTSETIIYAEEVLANSISNNTILSFRSRNYRNPRVGTCIYKLYINTVNNLTGSPIQIARFDASANQGSNPFERDYLIKDNTLNGLQFNSVGFTDLIAANVNQGTTTYNINTTYYWILTAQPNTSSDSLMHSFSILERI